MKNKTLQATIVVIFSCLILQSTPGHSATPPVMLAPKIPIDSARWFVLNYAPDGIAPLFDGKLTANPSTGYGSFMPAYEMWYPLNDGEQMTIKQVRMYDLFNTFADNPATIWLVKENGQRKKIASFTGSKYNVWVGPYPERTTQAADPFALDTAQTDFRYIMISCFKNNLPAEIEFLGDYTPPAAYAPTATIFKPLVNATGINGFEWDFVVPSVNSRRIDSVKYAPIKAFRGFRHYVDWQRIENTEGSYTFNPCNWGGWDYDMTYQRCKQDSIEVLVCLQNVPPWMRNTYPADQNFSDNSPLKFGLDRSVPASYIEKSRAGFQLAARYGSNPTVPLSLIKVNTQPRWPNDPPNQVKVGLGYIKYIECDNEANKWWRGRQGYLSAFEYAANLSAFYDGHMGSLGSGTGVKNADNNMQVVMTGMADADVNYVRAMVEWCRMNRGYRPDGSVNICWDVINYHHYVNDKDANQTGNANRGMAPELGKAAKIANDFVAFSKRFCGSMPVWITETGYDLNQQSTMKAIPIGTKTPLLVQADWNLRTALLYMRNGIDRIFFYELNDGNAFSSTKYATMGLSDSLFQLRPAGNYLQQMRSMFGQYRYQQTLSANPVADVYKNGNDTMYALWLPAENANSSVYNLQLAGAAGAYVYKPSAGAAAMAAEWIAASNGVVQITVSATPVFVVPVAQQPNLYYSRR